MRSINKIFPNFIFNTKSIVYDRSLRITKSLVGKRISIYNGKSYVSLLIREHHVSHRFGQFIKTKKKGSMIHKKDSKKKK